MSPVFFAPPGQYHTARVIQGSLTGRKMPTWPEGTHPVTSAELTEVIDASTLVGVHCWASWNGHDYKFAQRLSLTLERFPSLVLCTMDIEDPSNVHLMLNWKILNVPAFVIYRNRTRLATLWMEQESVPEFQQRIEKSLADASI